MDLNELQRFLNRHMQEQNRTARPDFEGYSPDEMHRILHYPFEPQSPIRLQPLSDADYRAIPILNLSRYLAGLLEASGEIRLTAKGYLPPKIVLDIYGQGFHADLAVETFNAKIAREADSESVHLTKTLLILSGLAKKRNNALSLTATGKKYLHDPENFLKSLLKTYCQKLNWAYLDGWGEQPIGKLGCGFSLILLANYGQTERDADFYAQKYLATFPAILQAITSTFAPPAVLAARCYVWRTFEKFMTYFGLTASRHEGDRLLGKRFVRQSDIFDKLIGISPHQG